MLPRSLSSPSNSSVKRSTALICSSTKKRYAGLVQPGTDGSVQTVRRDNFRLVQTVIETCLHKMLIERDVKGAEVYVFSA